MEVVSDWTGQSEQEQHPAPGTWRCRPVRRLAIVRMAFQIHPDLSSFYLYLTDQLGKVVEHLSLDLARARRPMHVCLSVLLGLG